MKAPVPHKAALKSRLAEHHNEQASEQPREQRSSADKIPLNALEEHAIPALPASSAQKQTRGNRKGLPSPLHFIKWMMLLLTFLLGLPVISSILNIANYIRGIDPRLEWCLYGGILIFLALLFFKLIYPVLRHSSLPASLAQCKEAQLDAVIHNQIQRGSLYEQEDMLDYLKEKEYLHELSLCSSESEKRSALEGLKISREKLIRRSIRQHGIRVGISTAISRNQLIDGLMMLSFSANLIKEIAEIYGLRPSNKQLIALYLKVLRGSYYAYYAENLSGHAVNGVMSLTGQAFEGIPGINAFAKAATDGLFNSMMVMRIGFITDQVVWGHEPSLKDIGRQSVKFAQDSAKDFKKALKDSFRKKSKNAAHAEAPQPNDRPQNKASEGNPFISLMKSIWRCNKLDPSI